MRKPLIVILSLLTLLSVTVLPACDSKATTSPAKKPKKAHLVEIALTDYRDLSIDLTRTGTLRARREVKIHNQEDGQITRLPFYEGDAIKEGDILVQLDDKLLRAQLARARATRHQAEQDLGRIRNLFKKKLVSDEELNRAETQVEIARADEEVLTTRLGYTTIRAPINGIVSQRLSEPGNVAEKHSHLMTLSDPASLVTDVTLSELVISKLQTGQGVSVSIDALGNKQYPGTIQRIYPNLDPVTRRGTVEVELKPVPKGARPGQLCRVNLSTQAAKRLVIPFSALRRDQQGEYVFIVDGENKAGRAPVVSGLRIGEQVEILEGIKAGEKVVTKGFLDLRAGKAVQIVDLQPAASDTASSPEKSTAGQDKPAQSSSIHSAGLTGNA